MIYEGIDRWNTSDSYLEHYGIKGMRWGHRKQRSLSGNFHRILATNNRVDVGIAKNKQTRRVAEDYQTSKKRFAKRYNKTNGDTYHLGKRKEALAKNFLRKREAGPSFGGGPDPMSKAGLLIKREATKAASEYYQKKI